MLGTSKNIWGFEPRSIPSCQIWLDASDRATMNSTTTVTVWNDKSGNSNNMTGTATLSGSNMTFNGSTQAFSNATYIFPSSNYSMFAVYSNTTAPASLAYMNAVYGGGGFPMLGTYGVNKLVSARPVVASTGGLTVPVGWATRISGVNPELGLGIATDSSGNVIVTGAYVGTTTLYNANGTTASTMTSMQTYDVFIAKYTSAGTFSWVARTGAGGTNVDQGNGIATDTSDNVFVVGQYAGALTLYGTDATTKSLPAPSGVDGFLAKYSSAGVIQWAARLTSGPSSDVGYAVTTDRSGNAFVTGNYGGTSIAYNADGTSGVTLLLGGCFVAKYTSTGVVSWAIRIASSSVNEIGYGIATDTSGNVFVSGHYGATVTLYSTDATTKTLVFSSASGGRNAFVAKYSPTGVIQWAARCLDQSGVGINQSFAIAVDSGGNVLVTGMYGTGGVTFYGANDATSRALPGTSDFDCFISKYTTDGAILWAAQITSTTTDYGYGITTDSNNNVYVTGYYGAALILYNANGLSGATLPWAGTASTYECFIAKYTSAGAVSWAAQIGSTSDDYGRAITADASGNVFVTGKYGASLGLNNSDGTSGASIANAGNDDCFIAKYSTIGFMNRTSASSNVLVSATYTPSTFSPFVNGSNAGTIGGITTLAATGLFVGGPSNYFNGSISEVLVYGSTLSIAQRQSIEGYLNKKWGITLSNVHPFFTQLPMNRTFAPTDIPGASLWLDASDRATMNSTTTVTVWNDKSGQSNTMTGTATLSGSNMTFNGSTQAFSNTTYVFPSSNYSMFAVYSNTTAPAASAYMNAVYGGGGFPMLGTFGTSKFVSARSVVANTGPLSGMVAAGWATEFLTGAGLGITSDTSGNMIVTGRYGAALTLYNAGGASGATLPLIGGNDGFIAKYTPAGVVSWAAQIAGTTTSDDRVNAVATDISGNIFVTGQYGAALTLYNTGGVSNASLPFTGGTDVFVAKYTSAGVVSWAAQITGTTTSADIGYGVATDPSGNVIVTGQYGAALTLYNSSGVSNAALPFTGGGLDCFIAKYTTTGAVSWAARIASSAGDIGRAIASDVSGNIFVTGQYGAALNLYNAGGTVSGATLLYTGGSDIFVAKYTSAGTVSWATRITGSDGVSPYIGYGIATDPSGNVFVTGQYGSSLTLYNTGGAVGTTLLYTGGYDIFVAKYTSAGAVSWAAQIASTTTSVDIGFAIATDPSGNVLVTGYYSGTALTAYNTDRTVGATVSNAGSVDCFVVKYTSAGAVAWATRIAGAINDQGWAIASDPSGNVFVTGFTNSALSVYNSDGSIGATPSRGGSFIVKYSPEGYIVAPMSASSNVLIDATYTPSTFSPFANGSNATTLAGTTLAATGIFVGGPSNYFNGSISELIVYGATLTADQRQQVEGYLASKWNLRSQIVAGHQYKVIPPATPQPLQYREVTQGNWNYDWQPYLKSLAAANATATASLSLTGVTASNTVSSGSGVLAPNGNIYFSVGVLGSVLTYYNPTLNSLATITLPQTIDSPAAGLGADGNVYIFPVNANTGQNIIRITTTTNLVSTIAAGANGWWGMVLAPNGNLYGIPQRTTTNVLVLNTTTATTSTITGTTNGYWGGVLAPNGLIYCIPGTSVAIINPDTRTITANAVTGTGQGNGYFGGVLGWDGNIYCIPCSGTGVGNTVGIINPNTNTFSTISMTAAFYSGGCLGPDGKIYCIPRNGGAIGVINIASQTFAVSSMTLPAVADAYNGATLTSTGTIYIAPYNGGAASHTIYQITFTGLAQRPSLDYCLSAWTNKF